MHAQQCDLPEGILILTPPSIEQLRDDEGRPLKEGKAPEHCRTAVPMQMVECRYAGSRFRHANPMNASALQQMARHWPEALSGFGYLRNLMAGAKPAGEITLIEFWKIARAGAILPEYLCHRTADPLGDGKLPAFVAVMYKAALGLFNSAQNIVLSGILKADTNGLSKADPDAIIAFADDTAMLVGEKEVCAGPANMIAEVTREITDGHSEHERGECTLAETIGDKDRLARFANQDRILYICNFLFPFLFYFQFVELFRVAQASVDGNEIVFPRGITAALVELEARHPSECRSLIDLSDQVKEFFLDGLFALLRSVDQRNQVGPLLKKARNPEVGSRQCLKATLLEVINSRRRLIAQSIDSQCIDMLIDKLSQYLLMERLRLQTYASIQTETNLALGRRRVCRELTGEDISARFGGTLRDIAEQHFGIQIESFPDRTILRVDELAFTVN
jgi:hypothetical protein